MDKKSRSLKERKIKSNIKLNPPDKLSDSPPKPVKLLTKDNILIMVLYFDVRGLDYAEGSELVYKLNKRVSEIKEQFEKWYIFPINGDTKLECLNPKLLPENEYQKVKEQFDKNQEKINEILKELKENENKN